MLLVFIYSIIIVIITIPFSLVLLNNYNTDFYYYSKSLILGVIIISSLSLVINFFTALNLYVTNIILLLSIFILLKNFKKFTNINFLKFVFFQAVMVFLLILESNVYRPDAGLYHLPYIGILNSEKIIIGLSNIHFRYAHTSALQYFSAASNNILLGNNGIVFAQALIATGVITNFLSIIIKNIRNKNYNFHHHYLIIVLIFIFYKMNRYSEYGNDAPSHFLYFFLISEIIINIENKKKYFLDNLLISLFIIQNKILLAPVIIFNTLEFRFTEIKNFLTNKKFIILNIIFISWLIKNLLISGCFIYPLKMSCTENLLWSKTSNISKISLSSEAWAKGWSDLSESQKDTKDMKKFVSSFNWLDAWMSKHLKLINKILLPYILLIFLILIYYYVGSRKKAEKFQKYRFYLLLLSLIPLAIWFYKAPLFRYGYSTIITFLSILFSIIVSSRLININKIKYVSSIILIIGILLFFGKNIIRIIETNNNYYNYPWPKFYSLKENNYPEKYGFYILNNFTFSYPINGYCMYNKSVCTHYGINDKLKIKMRKYLIIH